METTPENVPDELLIQVKVVHAQLLIKPTLQTLFKKFWTFIWLD